MLKKLIEKIKEISLSHLMIKSFMYGDNFNIQKDGELEYPNFYVEYPFNIIYNKNYKEISFSFFIADIPEEGQTDDLSLISKLEQINDDILMKLDLNDYDEFGEILNINSITLNEWMGDRVVAVRTDITFKLLRNLDNCQAPFI